MHAFYPPIEPFHVLQFPVSPIHTLYVEQVGHPKGIPVVFLHGGPGGGLDPDHRRYFDPNRWHVVLFDQRGCGKSAPFGSIEENTTWDLVADIERIRTHLGIEQWYVFGGSWGSTLSLAYAQTHPERVLGLILRGIFLLREREIQWFYQYGASELFPEYWEQFLAPIPPGEQHDLLTAYHRRLTSNHEATLLEAARAWSTWEGSTSKLLPNPKTIDAFGDPHFAYAFARIECHYFFNKGFFQTDGQLLHNAHRLQQIKGTIIQGRYDMPCPVRSAFDLHRAWPNSKLVVVPDAGHAASEPGIRSALIQATDHMAETHPV